MSGDPAGAAFALRGLGHDFGRAEVLRDLTLEIARGERLAIIGPSGAGKTTLLRLLAALLWPSRGEVRALGRDTRELTGRALRELRSEIGLLQQSENLVPGLRVVHNVLMGRLGRWSTARALVSLVAPRELDTARAALAEVEIEDRLWDLPGTLSGGQQQRVAIARLLVQSPSAWLADEPTSNLDPRLGRDVIQMLARITAQRRATLVVCLHDLDLLGAHFDRVVALKEGRLFWDGPVRGLTHERLQELYGAEYRALRLGEVAL